MVGWLIILALVTLAVADSFFEPFGTPTSYALTVAIVALCAAMYFETKRRAAELDHSQEGTEK